EVERLVATATLLTSVDGEGQVAGLGAWAEDAGEQGGHRGSSIGFIVSNSAGRTSTRLSKKVAPPPMSVRAEEVVLFTLAPPGLSLFQEMPVATATPGRTVPWSATRARKVPRSLKTSTHWSATSPRRSASSFASSIEGSPAAER